MVNKNAILLVSLAGILIVSILLVYSFYIVVDVQTLNMDIEVSDRHGLNLDTDILHYGETLPGGQVSRGFVLSNKKDYPLKATIIKQGSMKKWVDVEPLNAVIAPKSNKTFSTTVYIPKNASFGKYAGKLKIILKRKFI